MFYWTFYWTPAELDWLHYYCIVIRPGCVVSSGRATSAFAGALSNAGPAAGTGGHAHGGAGLLRLYHLANRRIAQASIGAHRPQSQRLTAAVAHSKRSESACGCHAGHD